MYKQKVCRICGKTFIPKSARQMDCNKVIVKECAICGKKFETICSLLRSSSTCSEECTKKYAKLKSEEAFQNTIKICEWCGKEFHPKNNTQKYCSGEHFANCRVCGKQFKVDLSKQDIRVTCSKECASKLQGANFSNPEVREKIKQTLISKYGVEHPAQNEQVKAKMRATTSAKYGSEYYRQTEEYEEKAKKTNLEKYGNEWAIASEEVREKIVQSNLEKYGHTSHMQNPEELSRYQDILEEATGYRSNLANPQVREKSKKTLQEKYGVDSYSKTEEFAEKFKETSLEKFGTVNPMQAEEVKKKSAITCIAKYGVTNYLASEEGIKNARKKTQQQDGVEHALQIPENRKRLMNDPSKYDEWMRFQEDPISYLSSFGDKQSFEQLSNFLGVSSSVVNSFILSKGLQDYVKYTISNMEDEVVSILRSIDPSIKIELHDRKIIKPDELDIFLPDYKLAIECNPTCTHNSSMRDPWGADPKSITYHKSKTDRCEAKGIFLFHIFGYEWSHRKDIIESMLSNLIGKNDCIVYARKCDIRLVSSKESRQFLDRNHRQGPAGGSIRLGLYYHDELMSLMTFGKMRSTIGTGKEDLSDCYELVRFCSKLNTSVVGGASKLFNYFVKTYSPSRIRSFSDRAHTKGNLYRQLKFNEIHRSPFGYVWVNYLTDVAYHRSCAQKHNIKSFLKDDSIDLTQSENEIMESHGYVRVYDSGTITWEWINDQ